MISFAPQPALRQDTGEEVRSLFWTEPAVLYAASPFPSASALLFRFLLTPNPRFVSLHPLHGNRRCCPPPEQDIHTARNSRDREDGYAKSHSSPVISRLSAPRSGCPRDVRAENKVAQDAAEKTKLASARAGKQEYDQAGKRK